VPQGTQTAESVVAGRMGQWRAVRAAAAPGFSRMVERAAVSAKLAIKTHAHMLRHACGYKLANDGHDTRALQAYLGHKNIQNTTRYTALAQDRFRAFWKD
jgi:site-specific recombinase XerD